MSGATLEQLHALDAIFRFGSITAAAESLDISTGAVSRRLTALESTIGIKLLIRSTRALQLTAAGKDYQSRVIPALEAIAEASEMARDQAALPQGHLRISIPTNYGGIHIAPHLPAFMQRYPDLSIDAQFDDRYVDLAAEGFDLAVRIGSLEDSSLIATKVGETRRVVVGSPDYLTRNGTPNHPSALTKHQCFHYTNFRGPAVWSFCRDNKQVDIAVNGRLRSNYGLPLTKAAGAGEGLVQTATAFVADALSEGRLVEVLRDWALPQIGIYAIYSGRKHLPAKVRVFINFLREILPQ